MASNQMAELTPHRINKGRCGRCGIEASAEYCQPCRNVDPEFTAGGRSPHEMARVRRDLLISPIGRVAQWTSEHQHSERLQGNGHRGKR